MNLLCKENHGTGQAASNILTEPVVRATGGALGTAASGLSFGQAATLGIVTVGLLALLPPLVMMSGPPKKGLFAKAAAWMSPAVDRQDPAEETAPTVDSAVTAAESKVTPSGQSAAAAQNEPLAKSASSGGGNLLPQDTSAAKLEPKIPTTKNVAHKGESLIVQGEPAQPPMKVPQWAVPPPAPQILVPGFPVPEPKLPVYIVQTAEEVLNNVIAYHTGGKSTGNMFQSGSLPQSNSLDQAGKQTVMLTHQGGKQHGVIPHDAAKQQGSIPYVDKHHHMLVYQGGEKHHGPIPKDHAGKEIGLIPNGGQHELTIPHPFDAKHNLVHQGGGKEHGLIPNPGGNANHMIPKDGSQHYTLVHQGGNKEHGFIPNPGHGQPSHLIPHSGGSNQNLVINQGGNIGKQFIPHSNGANQNLLIHDGGHTGQHLIPHQGGNHFGMIPQPFGGSFTYTMNFHQFQGKQNYHIPQHSAGFSSFGGAGAGCACKCRK